MHETSARGWCTGKTQRDQVERNCNKNKSTFYIFICSGWSNFPFSIVLFWKYFSASLLSEKLFRFHFEEYFPWIQNYFLFRTFKIFSCFMASLFLELFIIIIFLFVIHFSKLFHLSFQHFDCNAFCNDLLWIYPAHSSLKFLEARVQFDNISAFFPSIFSVLFYLSFTLWKLCLHLN